MVGSWARLRVGASLAYLGGSTPCYGTHIEEPVLIIIWWSTSFSTASTNTIHGVVLPKTHCVMCNASDDVYTLKRNKQFTESQGGDGDADGEKFSFYGIQGKRDTVVFNDLRDQFPSAGHMFQAGALNVSAAQCENTKSGRLCFPQLGLEPNHTGLTAQSLFSLEELLQSKTQ